MLFAALVCVHIICPYPSHFSQFSEHDHYSGVVLPQHPPEVLSGLCQRALCGQVGLLLSEDVTPHRDIIIVTFYGAFRAGIIKHITKQ